MHCVSSLPSRVPSQGRAAGRGTLSRSPGPVRRVPSSRAALSAQPRAGQGSGRPGTATQPRGQLSDSRCPRCPALPFPGAADQACLPRLGGSAAHRLPPGTALGGGTTLSPKQPTGLKKNPTEPKPALFPRSLSPAPAQHSLLQFRADSQHHPVLGQRLARAPALTAQRDVLAVPRKAP